MPELPEVEAVRRELEPAMCGVRFADVVLRRANLRRPFPPAFADRLRGRTVYAVSRRGKYLLLTLSSAETLVMHLGMSGSFRVEARPARRSRKAAPADADRHDHVVFTMSSGAVITFNDPRRFGVMDLASKDDAAHGGFLGLGPEPLAPEFGGAVLARACKGKKISLKVALLDQRVVAGVGNIYASEALNRAQLSPRRRASTIATPSGLPRETADRLAAAIKQVLREAVARQTATQYRSSRFRVYDREGEPCLNKGCGGTIRRITQAGRSTFYCPVCQK